MDDDTVVAKYTRNNETFEIFVNAYKAHDFIKGKIADPILALDVDQIFKDAKKGERQGEENIQKAFGTKDLSKVIATILKNGHVPLTTDQKNKMLEEKRKQIIEIIARNSIDPRTKAPNPIVRIESAMKDAKVSVDPFKSAQEQIDDVIKKINIVMPIKFAVAKVEITIPAEHTNGCYGILKRFGMKSEQWSNNGSLIAILEFPAGMRNELFDKVNSATHGSAIIKIVEDNK